MEADPPLGKRVLAFYLRSIEQMISKKLAIAAAIALLTGFGAGQASAQTNNDPPAPTMASPSGAPATATPGSPDQSATPGTTDQSAAPAAPAPAVAAPPPAAPAAK